MSEDISEDKLSNKVNSEENNNSESALLVNQQEANLVEELQAFRNDVLDLKKKELANEEKAIEAYHRNNEMNYNIAILNSKTKLDVTESNNAVRKDEIKSNEAIALAENKTKGDVESERLRKDFWIKIISLGFVFLIFIFMFVLILLSEGEERKSLLNNLGWLFGGGGLYALIQRLLFNSKSGNKPSSDK